MKTKILIIASAWLAATLTTVAGTLKLDKEKSRIQVDVKATGHQFTGTLSDYTITISGDDKSLAPTAANLSWKFADLKTGDGKRDIEMLKWLGGKTEGGFKFTKTWKKDDVTFAMGSITIHGVSKDISFPFAAKSEDHWVTVDGTATLDYEDFGLPIIKTMAVMKVDPVLSVRFHLVGRAN